MTVKKARVWLRKESGGGFYSVDIEANRVETDTKGNTLFYEDGELRASYPREIFSGFTTINERDNTEIREPA